MTTKITRDIVESYLNCKYEGHLKLVGQRGIQSDYGVLLAASRDAVRRLAANSVKELIALAKTKSLNYGSSGVGGTGHLAGELFN